jgi:hypothetical protein
MQRSRVGDISGHTCADARRAASKVGDAVFLRLRLLVGRTGTFGKSPPQPRDPGVPRLVSYRLLPSRANFAEMCFGETRESDGQGPTFTSTDLSATQMDREDQSPDREGRAPSSTAPQRRAWTPAAKASATFAIGIALIAIAGALTLTNAPPRLVRIGAPGIKAINSNGAPSIGRTFGDATVCQSGEVLPAGVSAVRLSLWAFYGAPVHLVAYSGSRPLIEGRRGAEWTSDSVTVPVKPLARAVPGAKVCLTIAPNSEHISILGTETSPSQAASIVEGGSPQLLEGRLAIEYLAPGRRSWWSSVLAVARHVGLGRAFAGTWIALLIAALMAATVVLSLRLAMRELG